MAMLACSPSGNILLDVPLAQVQRILHPVSILPTAEAFQPGHPQQNGRHERMHLTLKNETSRPAGMSSLQQQSKFDDFLEEFNNQPAAPGPRPKTRQYKDIEMNRDRRTRRLALVTRCLAVQFQKVSKNFPVKF